MVFILDGICNNATQENMLNTLDMLKTNEKKSYLINLSMQSALIYKPKKICEYVGDKQANRALLLKLRPDKQNTVHNHICLIIIIRRLSSLSCCGYDAASCPWSGSGSCASLRSWGSSCSVGDCVNGIGILNKCIDSYLSIE